MSAPAAPAALDRRLAVAPMMDRTDRHQRHLMRLITRRTLLYTEMVTTGAMLHGDRERLLGFDPMERPLALQVGGSDAAALARCARLAEALGYDEVNLNVGCPSDRVQTGRFGACLMLEPARVRRAVAAMRDAVAIPITVKTRIGVDHRDRFEDLLDFAGTVARAGCTELIIHARKAWLSGLSPKENREVPPLRYDRVEALARARPDLTLVLNGGVTTLAGARALLARFDGVMIGRAAYHDPFMLAEADRSVFGDHRPAPTRREVLRAYLPYVERRLASGDRLVQITRHLAGLFQGLPGARAWRRHLSEHAHRRGAGPEVIERAAAFALEAAGR